MPIDDELRARRLKRSAFIKIVHITATQALMLYSARRRAASMFIFTFYYWYRVLLPWPFAFTIYSWIRRYVYTIICLYFFIFYYDMNFKYASA